jgi:protoheme IX farnesyltransferase
MMPVVSGKKSTRWQILLYSLLLLPLGLTPALIGLGGPLYATAALVFGSWMLADAVMVLRERDEVREPAARKMFGISILYLFALFAALIAERIIGIAPPHVGGWM